MNVLNETKIPSYPIDDAFLREELKLLLNQLLRVFEVVAYAKSPLEERIDQIIKTSKKCLENTEKRESVMSDNIIALY